MRVWRPLGEERLDGGLLVWRQVDCRRAVALRVGERVGDEGGHRHPGCAAAAKGIGELLCRVGVDRDAVEQILQTLREFAVALRLASCGEAAGQGERFYCAQRPRRAVGISQVEGVDPTILSATHVQHPSGVGGGGSSSSERISPESRMRHAAAAALA
jgi:hypothetical protein